MAGIRFATLLFLALAISLLALAFQQDRASAIHWWNFGAQIDLNCDEGSCTGTDGYATGESADMITSAIIPHPSSQFAAGLMVSFYDPDFQMVAGSSLDGGNWGSKMGVVTSTTYLGTLNNPCNTNLPVVFPMYNATTDVDETFVVDPDHGNVMDPNPAGTDACTSANAELPNHVDCYPDYNNRVFDPDGTGPKDPIAPIARLSGYSTVAGADILLQFLVFDKGAFPDGGFEAPHPYSQFTAEWGYPSVILLLNPADPAAPSPINYFCSPMVSKSLLYGKNQDNPNTTAVEGGEVVRQNPATAGTHYYHYLAVSYRNADEDPYPTNYDSCKFCYNQDDQFLVDSDGDGMDPCCDPDGATNAGDDYDSDEYLNGNDYCPTVYNPYPQNEGELSAPWPQDAGPRQDEVADDCEGDGQVGTGTDYIILPAAPTAELGAACNNNVDDDHDGWFDEGCDSDKDISNGTYKAALTLMAVCIGEDDDDGDGWCNDDETALGSPPDSAPGGDHDGDGFANPPDYNSYPYSPCTGGSTTACVDNCPVDYNPTQADADSDGIGDLCDLFPNTAAAADYDGDGYNNNADPCPQHKLIDLLSSQDDDNDGLGDGCDPMPNKDYSPFGRPENASLEFYAPLTNAGARPPTDEKIAMDGLQQICDDFIDNDGDTKVDGEDSDCSYTYDRDNDGGEDGEEWWVGTDRLDTCGNDCKAVVPPAIRGGEHDAWPYDINTDCWCNASDILMFPAQISMPIQKGVADPHPYQQRYDVSPDNWINAADILMFPARVAMPLQCTNP